MKQLILFFCLVALVPLGISAQEDHDIVASLNLKEVVILADGQTFEEYLIKQVLDHAQPLKKRVRTLSYSVTPSPYDNLCRQTRGLRTDCEGPDRTQGVWHHRSRRHPL